MIIITIPATQDDGGGGEPEPKLNVPSMIPVKHGQHPSSPKADFCFGVLLCEDGYHQS